MNCFLRAADYYRQAEFYLEPDDPRRLPTFTKMEACSHKFLAPSQPARARCWIFPMRTTSRSTAISSARPLPGTGSRADLHGRARFHQGRDVVHAGPWRLQRGISVLMIDGPGQGGTLRRHRLADPRSTMKCRSANASTGWLRAPISIRRASPSVAPAGRLLRRARRLLRASAGRGDLARRDLVGRTTCGAGATSLGLATHINWVFGARDHERSAWRRRRPFTLEGPSRTHEVPLSGAAWRPRRAHRDGGAQAPTTMPRPMASMRPCASLSDETGAEHCQHDNPTIGQEVLADWLADKFGIDQRALLKISWSPLQ